MHCSGISQTLPAVAPVDVAKVGCKLSPLGAGAMAGAGISHALFEQGQEAVVVAPGEVNRLRRQRPRTSLSLSATIPVLLATPSLILFPLISLWKSAAALPPSGFALAHLHPSAQPPLRTTRRPRRRRPLVERWDWATSTAGGQLLVRRSTVTISG